MPPIVANRGGLPILGWVTLAVAALTCGTVILASVQGPPTVTVDEIVDRMTYMDPKEGTAFELGELGGSPVIIAFLGDCASCSIHKTNFDDLRQTGGYRVVGVYEPGASLKNVSSDYKWLRLVEDKSGLHDKLNVYYRPRAYAFDGLGRLIALQRPNEQLASFVQRVGSKL
jgi:hypothetical protein